jgi:hypothetical protein
MNYHKVLLLLVPFLLTTHLNAGKDPKQPSTPGAPRAVRLDPQERRNRIENQQNPAKNNPIYAPQQHRLSRKERDRKIKTTLAVLKPGSRSPSPLR